MAKATTDRAPAGEVHGTARLTLFIDGWPYSCRPIDSDLHVRTFRLQRRGGEPYHVSQDGRGLARCECGDAEFRRRECKHVKALRAVGLLGAAPTPPTPALRPE